MVSLDALLVGVTIVGIVHMAAPDHWVTLSLLSKSLEWSDRKLFGISILTATGHAVFSATLGLVILVAGLAFSQTVSVYLSFAVGAVMLVAGLLIGIHALTSGQKRKLTPEHHLLCARALAKLSWMQP